MSGTEFGGVRAVETHLGIVLLVGDRALKLRKPVLTGFLDLRAVERRRAVCRREIELNRRISPQVYLGVAELDGAGYEREPVVVMRRMPDDRRLARLVEVDDPRLPGWIGEIADLVAGFHRSAERSTSISAAGSPQALLQRWRSVIDRIRAAGAVGADLGTVERLATGYVDGRHPLLLSRVRDGRIVDGHGDLLADDIFCLDEGPQVLDCLEFDDALRSVDVVDDICFLVMDLERRGAGGLAASLLQEYRHASGETAPDSLVHHYCAYRALVRASVAVERQKQHDPAAAARVVSDTALALAHLRSGRPTLVLVGGDPGTGKTTVSAELAAALGAQRISSDDIRAGLLPSPPVGGHGSEVGVLDRGRYAPQRRAEVYRAVLDGARRALSAGRHVVLDATWREQVHRDAAGRVAADTSSCLVQLRCTAPADLVHERLARRRSGSSQATVEIGAALAGASAPWPAARDLDTSVAPTARLTAALGEVDRVRHG